MSGGSDGIPDLPECPITFEAFEEKGRNQPLFLPGCGHTFSREGVQSLLKKTREAQGLTGKKAKGKPVCVTCPHCSMVQKSGTIDDFLPNWSVVQQIQAIKQQMADRDEKLAEGKTNEDTDVSEKENTHSQQHSSSQHSEAAPPRTPQSQRQNDIQDSFDHLQLTDEHQSALQGTQDRMEPPYNYPVASTSAPVLQDQHEEEVWQTWVDPPVVSSSVPPLITQDRAASLPSAQVASNRSALSGEMFQLVLNAVKPYLAGGDLFEVAQALSDIMINGATSTSALVDVLARRIPVLHHIGNQWLHIGDTGCVESEEEVVQRARHSHRTLEKTEHDRIRKAAAGHPSLRNGKQDPMMLIRREGEVKLRVGSLLADRAYAGIMGCGGYGLEESPMEDVPPRETPLESMKRLAELKAALEHAYENLPKNTDTMEDVLVPKMFFCAAAAAFSEILPPIPPTQLAAARAAVLSGMMLPSIEAMLVPAYGADAGANLAHRASKLLCDNAPNADSLLALCASRSSELPPVVESAVDYLICSEPSCLTEPPAELLAADPPLPPHLAYIPNSRMQGFTDESFITAQDRAIELNGAMFGAASGGAAAFKEVPGKKNGKFKGNHGPNNTNNAPLPSNPSIAQGARGGRNGNRATAPIPDGLSQGSSVMRRMYGNAFAAGPTAGGRAKQPQDKDPRPNGIRNHLNVNAQPQYPHSSATHASPSPLAGQQHHPQGGYQSPGAPNQGHLEGTGVYVNGHAQQHAPPHLAAMGVRPGTNPNPHVMPPHAFGGHPAPSGGHHPQAPPAAVYQPYHPQYPQQPPYPTQPLHHHQVPQPHHQQYQLFDNQIDSQMMPRGGLAVPARPRPNGQVATGATRVPAKSQYIDMPHNALYSPLDEVRGSRQQLAVRPGSTTCAHFEKFGWCLYGESCGHHHEGGQSVVSNLSGFPIRPGTKVCKFFMLNGFCAYAMNCHFNHPNICPISGPDAGCVIATGSAFEEE